MGARIDRTSLEKRLVKIRPAAYMAKFGQMLKRHGADILERLYFIATNRDIDPNVQLRAIEMITKLSGAQALSDAWIKRMMEEAMSQAPREVVLEAEMSPRDMERYAEVIDSDTERVPGSPGPSGSPQ